MPKEAIELANFMALVIDTTTKSLSPKLTPSEIRYFEKGMPWISMGWDCTFK
jgi:hypothetical protein